MAWRGIAGRHAARNLFLRSARQYAAGMLLGIPLRIGEGIFLLEQQPFIALAPVLHQDDGEFALELLSVQAEFEIAASKLVFRRQVAQ